MATEQRQKMMTSGRFKVMFNNERYNKSFCYSELILTDNEKQKSFASGLRKEIRFMSKLNVYVVVKLRWHYFE
jgi:hypothetical protein